MGRCSPTVWDDQGLTTGQVFAAPVLSRTERSPSSGQSFRGGHLPPHLQAFERYGKLWEIMVSCERITPSSGVSPHRHASRRPTDPGWVSSPPATDGPA